MRRSQAGSSCGDWVEPRTDRIEARQATRRAAAARALLTTAFAAVVIGSLFSHGGYYAVAGGLLGAAAVVAAMASLALGPTPRQPALIAAWALMALGAWGLLSTGWGGLPAVGLDLMSLAITGAACLLLGASLGRSYRIPAVAGVTLGLALHAAITLVVVAAGGFPSDWFDGRQLEGSLGYHNALGTAYALAVPLALWFADDTRRVLRFAGMTGAGVLVGAALLTQSRGTALAVVVGLVIVAALSRSTRTAVDVFLFVPAGVVLFLALRPADDALLEASVRRAAPDQGPLTTYAIVTFAVALVLGAIMALTPERLELSPRIRKTVFVAGGVAVVCAIVAAAVVIAPRADDLLDRLQASPNSPSQVGGGSTRLTSISPTGRIQQWRVALEMAREKPLAGHGVGSFAPRWGIERENKDLYVIQPHSIELETLSELGAVGAALLVATIAALIWLVWTGPPADRRLRAAVAAATVPFVLLASVDWVFSFPLLLGSTLLLLGIAGGRAPHTRPSFAVVAAGAVVALAVLAGPTIGGWYLDRAQAAWERSPADASSLAARARTFDRWDPDVLSFQARLLEGAGAYDRAAALYARAADLSRQPWLDLYRRARALRSGGHTRASRTACRAAIAANPLERVLRSGVCDGVEP